MDFKNHLIIAGKLTLICFCAVLLLSIVNIVTAKRIAENEIAEETKALQELFPDERFPGKLDFTKKKFSDSSVDGKKEYYYSVADSSGAPVGYVASVLSSGYGGELKLLVAVDPALAIIDVKLMRNNETPGIGKKFENVKYIGLFRGANSDEYPFPMSKSKVKPEYKDGVTGATITFNAARDGGLRAIELFKAEL